MSASEPPNKPPAAQKAAPWLDPFATLTPGEERDLDAIVAHIPRATVEAANRVTAASSDHQKESPKEHSDNG
jgi:hypothetical protein